MLSRMLLHTLLAALAIGALAAAYQAGWRAEGFWGASDPPRHMSEPRHERDDD